MRLHRQSLDAVIGWGLVLLAVVPCSYAYTCATPQTTSVAVGDGHITMFPGCDFGSTMSTLIVSVDVGAALAAAQSVSNASAVFVASGARFHNTHLVFNATGGNPSAIPYDLLVSGCEYRAAEEMIVLTGAFPSGSRLRVANNSLRWDVSYGGSLQMRGGIYFSDAALTGTSVIEISSNDVVCAGYARPLVTVGGVSNITDYTVLNVSNNALTVAVNTTNMVTGAVSCILMLSYGANDQVEVAKRSSVTMSNNTITGSGSGDVWMVAGLAVGNGPMLVDDSAITLDTLQLNASLGTYVGAFIAVHGLVSATRSIVTISDISMAINLTDNVMIQSASILQVLYATVDINHSNLTVQHVAAQATGRGFVQVYFSIHLQNVGGVSLGNWSNYTQEDTQFTISPDTQFSVYVGEVMLTDSSCPGLMIADNSQVVKRRSVVRGYVATAVCWYIVTTLTNSSQVRIDDIWFDVVCNPDGYGSVVLIVPSPTGGGGIVGHSGFYVRNATVVAYGAISVATTMLAGVITEESRFVFSNMFVNATASPIQSTQSFILFYIVAQVSGGSSTLTERFTVFLNAPNCTTTVFQFLLNYCTAALSNASLVFRDGTVRGSGFVNQFYGSAVIATEFAKLLDGGTLVSEGLTVDVDLKVVVASQLTYSVLFLSTQFSTAARMLVANCFVSFKILIQPGAASDVDTSGVFFSSGATMVPTNISTTYPLFEMSDNTFNVHVNSSTSASCALYSNAGCSVENPTMPVQLMSVVLDSGWDASFGGQAFQLIRNVMTLMVENRFVGSSLSMFAVVSSTVAPQSMHPVPFKSYLNRLNIVMLNSSQTMPPLYAGYLMNASVSLTACGDRVMTPTGELPCTSGECYPYNPSTNSSFQVLNCTATPTLTDTLAPVPTPTFSMQTTPTANLNVKTRTPTTSGTETGTRTRSLSVSTPGSQSWTAATHATELLTMQATVTGASTSQTIGYLSTITPSLSVSSKSAAPTSLPGTTATTFSTFVPSTSTAGTATVTSTSTSTISPTTTSSTSTSSTYATSTATTATNTSGPPTSPVGTITTTALPSTTPTDSTAVPCDRSTANARLAELPLFAPISITAEDVRNGFTAWVGVSINVSSPLLSLSNATVSIPNTVASVVSSSVVGNPSGFAAHGAQVRVYVVNRTTVRVKVSGNAAYVIAEDEGLLVSVVSSEVVGASCGGGDPVTVGTLRVSAEEQMYDAPSSVATTVVGGGAGAAGVGGAAGLASEQQGLSALAMFSCADPHTRQAFGSYRALSPFAIYESYAGVVLGNVIVTVAVLALQATVLVVLRLCRRTRRWIELMSESRFPAMTVNVLLAFHTGTAYASSQLVSLPGDYVSWEVGVGGVGFAFSVVLPAVLMAHPYYRVGRAYQEYELGGWLLASKWPAWAAYIIPQGAMYSPETRRAYGSYVSSYRAPAKEVWWTSYPTWTACVIGLGGLFHPTTVVGCQALFSVMGAACVGIGCVVAWRRPLRSLAGTYLSAASKIVLGVVLFCLADAVTGSSSGYGAVFVFGVVLTTLTIMRLLHALACAYCDVRMSNNEVPLSTVWSHIPGESKKKTHAFSIDGAADLCDTAARRDTGEDTTMVEMDESTDDYEPPSKKEVSLSRTTSTSTTSTSPSQPADPDGSPPASTPHAPESRSSSLLSDGRSSAVSISTSDDDML